MKNKIVLFAFLFLNYLTVFGQNKPKNEILVYFTNGIEQQINTINGENIKSVKIKDNNLHKSLEKIGIRDSLIEIAMPDFNIEDTLKVSDDGSKVKLPNWTKLYKIKLNNNQDKDKLLSEIKALPEVLFAESNTGEFITHSDYTNDPQYRYEWWLNNFNKFADIDAEKAWDIFRGDPNGIIAIIDPEGVNINEYDLRNKIAGGDIGTDDSDGDGNDNHGTAMAGLAAAATNNGIDMAGVDWYARIHPQNLGSGDVTFSQSIHAAVDYSSNVRVLSMSFGTENSIVSRSAIAYAYKANRICVASMGNYQKTNPNHVYYPAGWDNVIAVGATDNIDEIYENSQQGSHIDVCAPGVGIKSLGDAVSGNGTSCSAAITAGLASLLKGYKNNLYNDDVERIIELGADDQEGPGFDNITGWGRINAKNSIDFLRFPYNIYQWAATGGTKTYIEYKNIMFIGVSGLVDDIYKVRVYEVRKAITFPNNSITAIDSWGRGVGTIGWRNSSINYGEGYSEIVPGTLTNRGATFKTYVYEVWDKDNNYKGWYPKTAESVTFAYTVLGAPGIIGSYIVCSSGSTYTVGNILGSKINWNFSSNLDSVSGSTNSINLKAIGNGAGWITVTVGTYTTPKYEVWAGPFISPTVSGQASVCPNSIYSYSAEVPRGHSASYSYSWTYPSNWMINNKYDNKITLQTPSSPNYGTVRVSVTNQCGASGYSGITVYPNYYCGGYYSVFPNPASDIINIEIQENSIIIVEDDSIPSEIKNLGTQQKDFIINLYNNHGSIVSSVKRSGLKFSIPLNNINNGIYIIELSDGKKAYRQNLIINHNL